MHLKFATLAFAAALLAAGAQAQTAQPLNLKLPPPPSDLPAASSTAAKPASGSAAPGAYYGDHSGRLADNESSAPKPDCDDATYNQAQMHGTLGMGVVSGSHMGTGSYQSGTVDITKNLGDCDHHTGSIGLSIGVGTFNGGGFNGYRGRGY